jgi:para-aminobenzoate synthetase component 1
MNQESRRTMHHERLRRSRRRVAAVAETSAELPLVEELAPGLTPREVCLRLSALPHLLFLDSSEPHPEIGRYSFVTADPFAWLTSRGPGGADPFATLAARLASLPSLPTIPALPPFQGGAAGLFGYDLCHHIERLPRPRFDEFGTPDLAVGIYDWVIAFDHLRDSAWIVSTGLPEIDRGRRRARAAERLAFVRTVLKRSPPVTVKAIPETVEPILRFPLPQLPGLLSNFDRPGYLGAVRRAIEYVHAGDCFQVNLSQRLLHPATLAPLDLYSRLRERNPSPFSAYFDLGDFAIASASPERFLRVENGVVQTRPIKGTRPRGASPAEDAREAAELLGSAKDRAENVMIIDLLRNDLGRVCAYGSVRVSAVCELESYRSVHHLVSEVRGHLRPGMRAVDLLRAAFPGGSVTGAPKVRAMEIIAELEPTARGPYCGSLGYIGFDGTMDASILIRTFTVGRGWVQFPVGGGVVADSTPEGEYAETLVKAEGMLRALRD